jgi:ABC-type Fe3+-hydroxamate transport system substrate-binding protein
MKTTKYLVSFFSALALTACANVGSSTGNAAVNTNCPMMPSHESDQTVTTDFNGQTIAFCCPKCISGWNKLDDGEKQSRLSKSMPQK